MVATTGPALLETRKLGKSFGGLSAVQDIDFSVAQGRIVSVIGPNGAGKSTFFNLITGLYKPSMGQVLLEGHDVTGLSPVRLNVQIVILTHEDPTHFSLQGLAGEPHLVTGAGEFELKGVAMNATQTYHDAKKGAERGKNFVYTLEIDDLRCCHLGHLGHALTE